MGGTAGNAGIGSIGGSTPMVGNAGMGGMAGKDAWATTAASGLVCEPKVVAAATAAVASKVNRVFIVGVSR